MAEVPLATRMRPRAFGEFVGQTHLVGPGTALSELIQGGHLPSVLLWGPAGSGKTTLAHLLADAVGAEVVQLSAVSSGVADARKVMERAKGGMLRTVLFVDEVHRWSKAQQDALDHLVEVAGGDARIALTGLEAAVLSAKEAGEVVVTRERAADAVQKKAIVYDRQGDAHYDVISAFIKSIRGSDPDATLFWLARMLEAGEDARYIARRMVVHASEDIGLAD